MLSAPMPSRFALFVFLAVPLARAIAQQALFESAVEKYGAKQYEPALALVKQALHEDGSNPAYLHLYGSILASLGRFDAAEDSFQKAVALAPEKPAYVFALGSLLHQQRRYANAVPVLTRSVSLDPGNLTARMMLARSYVFSYHELKLPNFVDLTLEQLNFIVKKEPRFPAVHHHLALVYINTGELAKALVELNAELQIFPGNAQARLELGETLLKQNENRKAADELLIAAKQAPQMPPIYYALGKAYKADGRADKAVDALRYCVELDPQFASCHYLLGQLYRDSNQPEQAKRQFELFQQLKRSSAEH
jgi:predicted Zn-dependent protease